MVCPPGRRRRRSVYLAILGLALLMYLGRHAILTALASLLIVNQSDADAAALLVLTGDSRFDEAVLFLQRDSDRRILLLDPPPGRLVRLKILPSDAELGRKELFKRGVSEDRIDLITWEEGAGSLASSLTKWLRDHPDARVTVACGAFTSRDVRWSLDRSMSSEFARRLTVRSLNCPEYSEQDWWQTKRGVRAFVRGWTTLLLPMIQRTRKEWRECNPELFQPAL